ncbi:MAG: polyprenyl synthetase family protein [Anaerolineae bacterium]|nr:polyprenyl synthetase family protein [Anaerolineae bacterium]MDW8300437.1 polyprenyl synthetase family protein [Anaerolineae bacterium]
MTALSNARYAQLFEALAERRQRVYDYLFNHSYGQRLRPAHIQEAAFHYLRLSGKSLRPAVLMLCCAAVGGNEAHAVPAAAGVELYHTWTLVHDDIIDRDETRRGAPTVHVAFAQRGAAEFGFSSEEAAHYGRVIGILAGDVQQSWSYMLFYDMYTRYGIDPALVLSLVAELATDVQLTLVEGETLDVQFAARRDTIHLSESDVLEMLRKKTGVLYAYAGRAGARIGLGDVIGDHPLVAKIEQFCSQCGTAFQLQDDILGVIGDSAKTGKPVGADLREGKKTLIVLHALRHADEAQRQALTQIIGNPSATPEQIERATRILDDIGSIAYTQQLAERMVRSALDALMDVPPSPYRDLLQQWAEYLIDRNV